MRPGNSAPVCTKKDQSKENQRECSPCPYEEGRAMMACLLDARTQAVIAGTLRTLLHTDDQQLQGWLRGQRVTNWAEVSYRDKKPF